MTENNGRLLRQQPLISIITTFYNSVTLGDFVHKSMDMLLNQTYKNIELICVNDGSSDNTLEQLLNYKEKDARIKIINKDNEGTAQYAKAAGQDAAEGDFIMLFDHDDTMSLDASELAVEAFINNSDLDMVGLIVTTQFSSGLVKNIYSLEQLLAQTENYIAHTITGIEALRNTIGRYDFHFRGFYRKALFKKVSFRFSEKLLNADEIVERQLLAQANKIGSCRGHYTHVIYSNSSAKSFNIKKVDIVATDMHLRKFAIKHELYEPRKNIFELVAYKNFITAMKVYVQFKPELDSKNRKFLEDRLRDAYRELDHRLIIKAYSGVARIYNQLLLSHFAVPSLLYKFKK